MRHHLTKIRRQKWSKLYLTPTLLSNPLNRTMKNGRLTFSHQDNSECLSWPLISVLVLRDLWLTIIFQCRNHGPRGMQKKKDWRKDPRILLLIICTLWVFHACNQIISKPKPLNFKFWECTNLKTWKCVSHFPNFKIYNTPDDKFSPNNHLTL